MKNFTISNSADVWLAENIYFLKSHPSRIGKFLAHYELYKKIVSIPGCFIELGVFRGASLVRFLTFRNLLENDSSRKFFGFDAFGEFPKSDIDGVADQVFISKWEDETGNGIAKDELERIISEKGFSNCLLFEGDVFQTLPDFLDKNPQLRIALLHLDLDVYEPTKFCLESLMPFMSRKGLVVFDDYNAVEGATRAADEICDRHGYQLNKLSFYNVPAYFEVP